MSYPVLSDSPRAIIRAYDVLHPQEGIARPAVFLIDREGRIRWEYVGMGASDRPSITVVLEQLEAAK